MAFKTSDIGGYGSGALTTVLNPAGQVNSYANVTAISTNTVTIGTASNGIYEQFAVDKEILLHVSAITSGTDLQYLGKYMVATITAVNGSVLNLNKDVSGLIASGVFANHHVQAITIAQFDTLNLTGTIAPLAYNFTNKYGGIIALKCKTALNLSGSARIDLVGKGIPIANIAARPATTQEGTASQIGWENHITSRLMRLNCPDGAAFIVAASLVNTGTTARIGAATAGVANYPYVSGGVSNTNVIGGPTIFVAAQNISGFDVSLIAKASSNTSGRGLGRCYIATNTKLPADELLYALDCLSNSARLAGMGIFDYGSGALNTALSLSGQVNSCANVSAISSNGLNITVGTRYNGAYEKIETGATIMFHVSQQLGSNNTYLGKFILAKILSIVGNIITLNTPVTNIVPSSVLSNYKCQLVTVAQFDTLAMSGSYTGAKAYDSSAGCGGILAIAAKTAMDLQGAQLLMTGKGIPAGTSRPNVPWQCSGNQGDCLPLSTGGGAVLIITNQLTTNSASRIGSATSGALYFGVGGAADTDGTPGGCGYGGGGAGGACGGPGGSDSYYSGSAGSSGSSGGIGLIISGGIGGDGGDGGNGADGGAGGDGGDGGTNGSNGSDGADGQGGSNAAVGGAGGTAGVGATNGGCSLFIVANTWINICVACISTGGAAGRAGTRGDGGESTGGTGGAGGGGGGGGGGGIRGGTCFIYVNTVTNPDYTAIVSA